MVSQRVARIISATLIGFHSTQFFFLSPLSNYIMAESFIVEATMAVLTTVLGRTAGEVKLSWRSKYDIKELEKKLIRIRMLLSVAADKRINNPLVDDWLSKVKNVAYEGDDLLDELAYEALKRRLKFANQSQYKKKLRLFFNVSSNPIVFRFQMGHKVHNLMVSIEDVFKDAQVLGIKPVDLAEGPGKRVPELEDVQLQVQRELVTSRGLIGRDQDEANIVRMLCNPGNADRNLNVVSIVGMAGLGKTALAKRVSDSNEIRYHFQRIIWICVSHDFNLKLVLIDLAEIISGYQCNGSNYQKMLLELSDKRYLLVLDDVWDTMYNVWESFTSELLNIHASRGSAILVTTRSYQVARSLETCSYNEDLATEFPQVYQLEGLNFQDSWVLFQQKVRVIQTPGSELEAIAKSMVRKCGGLPLAIRVLSDLLRSKNTMKDWREIRNSAIWNSNINNGILPSLKLSFNYLPSASLKKCFAYCAIFPEDATIRRETLIQLWMAQGFLHPEGDVKLDDWGNVKECKMHDAVRVLAIAVWRQEWVTLREGIDLNAIGSNIRHLSLLTPYYHPTQEHMKHLRTLASENFKSGVPQTLLVHAKCLRVLSLVHCNLKDLPDSISLLKLLKYLDISENCITLIRKGLVNRLYHLQTLRLHCMRLGSTFPTLPKELSRLINLTYVCSHKSSSMGDFLKIPLVSCLENPTLVSGHSWGGTISDLEPLNNLCGSLALWQLELVTSRETARKANLCSKGNLKCLDLAWSYSNRATNNINICEEVLEELRPHENIEALNIWYYKGANFPSWSSELSSLMQIKIYYSRNLRWLSPFSVLPSLKVLVVWGCDSLTTFPHLNGLNFLEKLQIGRCPSLICLPDVKDLTKLHTLEIHNCGKITTLPKGLSVLSNLTHMDIGLLSQDLHYFPFPADITASCPLAKSLRKLRLVGWPNLGNLPDQLVHFTELQTLSIANFAALEYLPNWLGILNSLEIVQLENMVNLKRVPSRYYMRPATRFRGFWFQPFHCPYLV
ncbi:putative disease resistance protein RGA1 isoform X3 [Beta vulgaris subsp. vulgaris]|uniref:putative disease resistance protein RGA1 isoform X3 n=1 Tax=Beta vulgaris subsp. vulgaris TaxID=3555 RepID=UPI002036A8A3|nr:putative disease resistance protein RGA1 isoform X3 [Beta vulgaris subsp. vulgaris]